MKRIVSSLLVIITLLTLSVSAFAGAQTLGTPVNGQNIEFTYFLSHYFDKELEYPEETCLGTQTVYYDDSWFKKSSFDYNHKLALASVAAAESAVTFDNTGTGHVENGDRLVRGLLEKLGFAENTIQTIGFDNCASYDDISAVAFAIKSIPDSDDYLIAVFPRSNGYGGEWASDMRIYEKGYEQYAAGFRKAAEYVAERLYSYIAWVKLQYGIDASDIKLWVAGHSRSAAVANNLGQILNDNTSLGIAPENMFIYGSAVPLTVMESSIKSEYKNVFNTCSEIDLVTRVPLVEWGYSRYGITYFMPCLSNDPEAYRALLPKVEENFEKLMKAAGVSDIKYEALDYSEKVIDLFASYLADVMPTTKEMKNGGWQDLLIDVIKAWKSYDGDYGDIPSVLIRSAIPATALIPDMIDFLKTCSDRTPRQNLKAATEVLSALSIRKARAASKRDIALISMFLEMVDNFRICLTSELLTGGQTDSLRYYITLIEGLIGIVEKAADSPLLMQHWPEAYIAWMQSVDPAEDYTEHSHEIVPLKRPTLIGDVNSDGNVDIKDVRLLQKYILAPKFVSIDKEAADIDGDGRICLCDAVRLELLLIVNL